MITRLGKLALVSALCVLASASAHAAGEFEAGWRAQFIEGYLKARKEAGDQSGLPQRANETADCNMQHVMQDFTLDEVARREREELMAQGKLRPERMP